MGTGVVPEDWMGYGVVLEGWMETSVVPEDWMSACLFLVYKGKIDRR